MCSGCAGQLADKSTRKRAVHYFIIIFHINVDNYFNSNISFIYSILKYFTIHYLCSVSVNSCLSNILSPIFMKYQLIFVTSSVTRMLQRHFITKFHFFLIAKERYEPAMKVSDILYKCSKNTSLMPQWIQKLVKHVLLSYGEFSL